jgi:hypothetical protein
METMTRDLKDINKIPILVGAENYREWANAVTTHLFRENSWAVIEGTSVKPTEPATVKATRSKDGEYGGLYLPKGQNSFFTSNRKCHTEGIMYTLPMRSLALTLF